MNETARGFYADGAFVVPPPGEQERMVEAVLFAARAPLSGREIAERLPQGCDIGEALAALRSRYEGRGVALVRIGDAWAFRTAADLAAHQEAEVGGGAEGPGVADPGELDAAAVVAAAQARERLGDVAALRQPLGDLAGRQRRAAREQHRLDHPLLLGHRQREGAPVEKVPGLDVHSRSPCSIGFR